MNRAAIGWLVRDVFRQARASGLTAALLAASAVAALVCLSAEYAPHADAPGGALTILFGRVRVIDGEPPHAAVRYFQYVLAGVVAGSAGVLLALVWTAGFLPSFVDPESASVLLAKPVPRGVLFAGKFAGVLLYVGVMALVFVAATWAALGLRTGVFAAGYWLSVPLLLLHFSVFYCFSALLAVSTRSTAACVVGSLLFWAMCWAMNYGRHALLGLELSEATAGLSGSVNIGYWLLPKPADFSLILADALDAGRFAAPGVEFQRVQEQGLFRPAASVLSSLAFGAALLGLAVYEFVNEDY